jgi:hypothetical protein
VSENLGCGNAKTTPAGHTKKAKEKNFPIQIFATTNQKQKLNRKL